MSLASKNAWMSSTSSAAVNQRAPWARAITFVFVKRGVIVAQWSRT